MKPEYTLNQPNINSKTTLKQILTKPIITLNQPFKNPKPSLN